MLLHDAAVLLDRRRRGAVSVQIPRDIEAMRGDDPLIAARRRRDVRGTLGVLMNTGWRVTDFRADGGYLQQERTTP